MNKRDYYEVLGVSRNATDDEIKSAFRKLAKKYHPDVSTEPDAATKFKEAQEAYAVLSDKEKRSQYDRFGHQAFEGSQAGGGFDFSNFDFSDIFGDIFGGGFGFNQSRNSNRPRKGADTLMHMNLTFEEAAFGCKKSFRIDVMEECDECRGKGGHGERTCPECHGSGTITSEQQTLFGAFMTRTTCPECRGKGKVYDRTCSKCRGKGKIKENKEIEIKIPAGVDTGNQLRVAGKGEAGLNGGPNGDIYVEFTVKPHPLFTRDDNDIYLEVPVTMPEAALGCKKEIPTLYGNIKISINDGVETGDKLRIKGKGIESVQTGRKGDMYAVIKVVTPRKLSKEQKKLFEALNSTDLANSSEFKKIKEYL